MRRSLTDQPTRTPMAIDYSKPPGFLRRMATVVYDALLLIAILFFATMILLPFNSAEAFAPNSILFSLYLFIVGCLFYCWFWTHGGQTLGMMAWKLQVVDRSGKTPDWKSALRRCGFGLLSWGLAGTGFLWILFNKERLALHDTASGTFLAWKTPEEDD